jgi:hypothetical protein
VLESAVIFETNGPIASAFTFNPLTSGIIINVSGVYGATFVITPSGANQFAFFLNGSPLASGIYGNAQASGNPGQIIFPASAGDILTVHNHSSPGLGLAVLPVSFLGPLAIVNASVLITRLA